MEFINSIGSLFRSENKIRWINIDEINIDSEIEGIFLQKQTEIENIAKNMIENQKNNKSAFDPAHPLILAYNKEHPEINNILADGHTRYKAAKKIGLERVAIIYKEFTREELLMFVYSQQLLRRNLTEVELYNAWSVLNRLRDEKGKKAKSDSVIAQELHVSRRTVAKMKKVEQEATPEILNSIKSGELSLNKAYNKITNEESKIEKATKSVCKSNKETKDVDLKLGQKRIHNTEYLKGYEDGWIYVYESLQYGKLPKELQIEFSELKAGTKSIELLQKSLYILKKLYEQKQTK